MMTYVLCLVPLDVFIVTKTLLHAAAAGVCVQWDVDANDVLLVGFVCICMQGCKSPLVVKFADTQRDKELKRIQSQQVANMNAGPGYLGMQAAAVSYFIVLPFIGKYVQGWTDTVGGSTFSRV